MIRLIEKPEFRNRFREIEHFIEMHKQKACMGHSVPFLLRNIDEGSLQLWQRNNYESLFITEFEPPNLRGLNEQVMWICYGFGKNVITDTASIIRVFLECARACGCDKLRISGRIGWDKVFKALPLENKLLFQTWEFPVNGRSIRRR